MFSLRRNIAFNVKSNTKLNLYKSLELPTVTYRLFCAKQSKAIMNALERLQKKAVKWIMGNKQTCYANSLRLLNILPLPMFVQMNDLLLFSSPTRGNLANILNLPTKMTCSARRPMNYQMKIPRTEKSRSEFFFRNCQIVNKVNNCFDIGNGMGLKDGKWSFRLMPFRLKSFRLTCLVTSPNFFRRNVFYLVNGHLA